VTAQTYVEVIPCRSKKEALRQRTERQMILLSAGVAARRRSMEDAAAALTSGLDWPALAETLRRRRLLTILGPRLIELARDQVEDDFRLVVDRAIEHGRRQGALLQLVAERVRAALSREGIRSAPLKGPMLGEAIYGDLGRRPSADIDLLVDAEQLTAAVDVVRTLGYAPPGDYIQACGLPSLHFALAHERGELPPVELHWRIHWYERSFARERLLPPAGAPTRWRPEPQDELAALLLFYARDGFVDLRLAADLSAWWDRFGVSLRIGALEDLLMQYPALGRVLPAAVRVAETVIGMPTADVFARMPRRRIRERVAVRLANPNPRPRGSVPQLNADMGLIDGLLMPRGQAHAFVRRQLLPPREVLRTRAQEGPESATESPAGHCARVLGRYALTMTHLLRIPEAVRL
jgi:Uncharacterised nucleotidyltransferase